MGISEFSHGKTSEFVGSILNDWSVQGLKFIGSRSLRIIERIFWACAVTGCIVYSLYLIHDLYTKFQATPVVITFQPEETSIQQIPFPAITLCNVNILKSSVLNKIYVDLIKAYDNSSDPDKDPRVFELNIFLEFMTQFCLTAPSFRRTLDDEVLCDSKGFSDILASMQQYYLDINETYILNFFHKVMSPQFRRDVLNTYLKAATNCHDMILRCAWSGEEIPCNETFFPLDTRHGRCCVFNMMPKYMLQNISKDDRRAMYEGRQLPEIAVQQWEKYTVDDIVRKKGNIYEGSYPQYQAAGGKAYGLSILVNPDVEEYSTCVSNDAWGFTMDAHSPLSTPSIRDFGSAIPANSEVLVEIEPYVTDANFKIMRSINIDIRECYLPTDPEAQLKNFNIYTAENCIRDCLAEAQAKKCLCVDLYLPNKNHVPCRAKQRKCAEIVYDEIMLDVNGDDSCGHCRPACTEINYKSTVTHFDLRKEVLDNPFEFIGSNGLKRNASNISIIHIFFGTDSLYIKERKSLYNIADLLADAGSLLGFTLGISIVSFVELLYFFTLRLFFYFRYMREKMQAKKVQADAQFSFDPYGKVKIRPFVITTKGKTAKSPVIYPFLR